jgi:hypothetical protein
MQNMVSKKKHPNANRKGRLCYQNVLSTDGLHLSVSNILRFWAISSKKKHGRNLIILYHHELASVAGFGH